MKRLLILTVLLASAAWSNTLFAGIVDVRFTNPSTQGNNFCVDVQVKAQDIAFELGSATVFFSYNTAAIRNPQHTPINFNEANTCASGIAPYKNSFSSLETGATGEGNYAIVLMYPNQGCPTVQSEWINVAQFCFETVDVTAAKNLNFNAQYTAFNTVANNGDQLSIGNLSGLDASVSVESVATPNNTTTITPNLTQGKVWLNLDLTQSSDVVIQVYDMLGHKVWTSKRSLPVGKHQSDIDLSKFSNGYYLVEVENGAEKTAHKVLLAK